MKTEILLDESLEDLQCGNLFLIQKKQGFRFGTDAVLLANFAKDIHSKRTLDLCTGTGIIPILLSYKTTTPEIHGLEIQESISEMANRSVIFNSLEGRINIQCGDLKDSLLYYSPLSFDLITCNPPYMKSGSAILSNSDTKIISRHEVMCTLEDIVYISSKLLKQGGHLIMVHRPNRLADVLFEMRHFHIEPKRLRFVHSSFSKPPILFFIDAINGANSETKVLPPLLLYDEKGHETPELKSIYERKE